MATISGYSAHADQRDLLNLIKRIRHWHQEVKLVHGDAGAKLVLKAEIEVLAAKHHCSVIVDLPENSSA